MKKVKYISLSIAEKLILTFEFLWATWWTFLGIFLGLYGLYKLFRTGNFNYLFSFLLIILSAWQMVKEWKDYKEKYKTGKK